MKYARNLIIGAGPGGLQLAHLLAKRGEDYLVLERGSGAGAFFEQYPRHERLLSINKVYTGYPDLESRRRYDWNSLVCEEEELQFSRFSRDYFPSRAELLAYLRAFARHYELSIEYGKSVTRVAKADRGFELTSSDGERYRCERLFVATGVPLENLPSIPGIELCSTYGNFSVDPQIYADKRVFILGKGNSAFETADELVSTTRKMWVCGGRTVRLAWATHYVGDLRAVNNNYLDTYQLKAQNNILDGELRAVRRSEDGSELVAEVWFESRRQLLEYRCDHVLLCTGFRSDFGIFDEACAPERRSCGRLPLLTCEWESVNVPNMFFVGTVMQSRDYRKTMSGFIHGFRHNIESLVALLAKRDGDAQWLYRDELSSSSDELSGALIERLSTAASLLLQPGFLGDVLLPREGIIEHLRNVPVDYAHERLLPEHGSLFLVTLEYREHDGTMDPFAFPRGIGVEEDFYLHPIIRRYEGGQLVDRFFLPDDLDNDWRTNPENRKRLAIWLKSGER